MGAKLLVLAGPDQGREFPLFQGPALKIGRSQGSDTQLSDPYVSRHHCSIRWNGTEAVLTNHSAAGTLVNGAKVVEHKLRHGDLIRMGGTELQLVVTAEAPDANTLHRPPDPRQLTAEAMGGDLIGRQLGPYQVLERIAVGQTGQVFRARDSRAGHAVALKVFPPSFGVNQEARQRFLRTINTVRSLSHPNLVKVFEAGQEGPHCWIAMEYVAGESLTQQLARLGVADILDWQVAFRVAHQVALALAYAHGQGVVHRNVTPANILLRDRDKQVFLGDLLLAKAMEGVGSRQVTRQGEVLGDLSYLPPERLQGQTITDPRADLYGLGATLYHLLTGRPPFVAEGLAAMMVQVESRQPDPPRRFQLGIPEWFERLVLRLLAKRTEDRPASAEHLLADLERSSLGSGSAAVAKASALDSAAGDQPFGYLAAPQHPGDLGTLAHYRVKKVIGEGGMGVVFLAEDTHLERPVALKVMRPELATGPEGSRRFLREARAMAKIRHDNVVTVYQVGQERDVLFMAMEFLEGEGLETWLHRGSRLTAAQVVRVGRETAGALAAAHAQGVIHRDIKPANLFLEAPRGRVKVLDFGLARPTQGSSGMTQIGVVVGTPDYMAPEQALGDPLDPRCDLFSLGCVLYELAAGRRPFTGATPMDVMTAIVTNPAPSLAALNPNLPPGLVAIIERLLAKKREDRFPTADALAKAFEALRDPARPPDSRA